MNIHWSRGLQFRQHPASARYSAICQFHHMGRRWETWYILWSCLLPLRRLSSSQVLEPYLQRYAFIYTGGWLVEGIPAILLRRSSYRCPILYTIHIPVDYRAAMQNHIVTKSILTSDPLCSDHIGK